MDYSKNIDYLLRKYDFVDRNISFPNPPATASPKPHAWQMLMVTSTSSCVHGSMTSAVTLVVSFLSEASRSFNLSVSVRSSGNRVAPAAPPQQLGAEFTSIAVTPGAVLSESYSS